MAEHAPTQIGHYTITREVDRGGMGVVYLARDTRLHRDVAIKSLPTELAADPVRLERFEREARTLASLNDPNLAGIHGVEEQDGARYLVLEYVDGETLADRLDRGTIPADEAVEIAQQICAGIEAAHDAGIIHRDLKPANIKVTSEGVVKVLDFGLARSDDGNSSTGMKLDSPTMTSPVMNSPTIAGAILGTAPYMSPEQARGRRVDKRTDIWSFGVVLYEMLTGIGPFHGETATDSIGASLHKDVELDRLPAGTPASVRRVLRRCLARDKQERYRDIGDVRIELGAEGESDEGGAAVQSGPRVLVGVLGVALLAALVGLGVVLFGGRAETPPVLRVTIPPPAGARILHSGDLAGPSVVSPDGTKIAYTATSENQPRTLWVQVLDQDKPRELGDTDGALFPFWSPDGREIGYFTTGYLWRYDLVSETVQRVCPVDQARGGSWTDDGRIIFSRNFSGGLWVVDEDGGDIAPLTEVDEDLHTSHRWPFVIPGTGRFLFSAVSARSGERKNNAIYLGSFDTTQPPERVLMSDYSAAYSRGNLLYVRNGVLLASRFDVGTGRVIGDPVALARAVAADISTWHGQFSVSSAGVISFHQARTKVDSNSSDEGSAWQVEGNRITTHTDDGAIVNSYFLGAPMSVWALSPNGRTVAASVLSRDHSFDIWMQTTAWLPRGSRDPDIDFDDVMRRSILEPERTRLTFLPGSELTPVWSPDSDEVAFHWDGDGTRPSGIYRKSTSGSAEILVYDDTEKKQYPTDWTTDGRYIITMSDTYVKTKKNDIWAIPVGGGEPIPLVVEPGSDVDARVSPNGKWLAYRGGLDTQREVYVIPFAPGWPDGAPAGKWIISQNGGQVPIWSREGDKLYYISPAGVLVAHAVDTDGDVFSFSSPRALFQTKWDIGQGYDVTPTGEGRQRFLFLESTEDETDPVSLIVNWPRLLEEQN